VTIFDLENSMREKKSRCFYLLSTSVKPEAERLQLACIAYPIQVLSSYSILGNSPHLWLSVSFFK
jgi:hypothetical protein